MPYWLGSLVIYLWASAFGDGAMAWFSAVFGALLAVLLLVDSRPRRGPWTATALVATAAVLYPLISFGRYRSFARPELLATVLLALVMSVDPPLRGGEAAAALRPARAGRRLDQPAPLGPVGVVPIGVMVASGLLIHGLRRVTGRELQAVPSLRALGLATAVGAATLLTSLLSLVAVQPLRHLAALRALQPRLREHRPPGGRSRWSG